MGERQTVDSMEQLARRLVLELRSRGDVADGAAVTEIRDSPTPWLTLEFTLYDFLPVAFFYDRGWGGFSVDYGSRRASLLTLTDVHFDHGRVRVAKAVDDVLTAARLRIPDKFLAARGWSAQQRQTESSTEGEV
ncbi:hypothetical protein [Microbacterium sp. IEGM 1404]|uniref:hypothetical protein n=1 Tax=Microbacterium sp. IEGM 1404 TaxID=3047084 RepID=UPI0024B7B3D3|nr:hypothetical protein [Microbacterium sp. IEGM 1404]MDI9891376.1 hypothetical protein [Microbacterium sp. IEGM 1404]